MKKIRRAREKAKEFDFNEKEIVDVDLYEAEKIVGREIFKEGEF